MREQNISVWHCINNSTLLRESFKLTLGAGVKVKDATGNMENFLNSISSTALLIALASFSAKYSLVLESSLVSAEDDLIPTQISGQPSNLTIAASSSQSRSIFKRPQIRSMKNSQLLEPMSVE